MTLVKPRSQVTQQFHNLDTDLQVTLKLHDSDTVAQVKPQFHELNTGAQVMPQLHKSNTEAYRGVSFLYLASGKDKRLGFFEGVDFTPPSTQMTVLQGD